MNSIDRKQSQLDPDLVFRISLSWTQKTTQKEKIRIKRVHSTDDWPAAAPTRNHRSMPTSSKSGNGRRPSNLRQTVADAHSIFNDSFSSKVR
jgi:hypothetical protein